MEIHTLLTNIQALKQAIEDNQFTAIELALIKNKLTELYALTLEHSQKTNNVIAEFAVVKSEIPPVKEEIAENPVEEKVVVIETVEEAPVSPAPISEVIEKIETETTIVQKVETPESITIVETVQTKIEQAEMQQPLQPEIQPKKKEGSLLDSFSSKESSLMDKFAPSSKGIHENVSETDLKKLIDFNRQFVFIQELFGNDPKSYMEAINQLNAMPDIQAAAAFINTEIAPKYKWNRELSSIKLFEKIIRQKFGV